MSANDDAQRQMEQRALRNVRGLVDKVESQDHADTRAERRMIRNLVIGAVIVVVAFVGLFGYLSGKDRGGRAVTIEQKR
jgi:hypothetical protein